MSFERWNQWKALWFMGLWYELEEDIPNASVAIACYQVYHVVYSLSRARLGLNDLQ